MNNDINFTLDNQRFNFRVAGFVTHQNKVLISKHNKQDFFNIPGGRVKMGESTTDAIARELSEELGLKNTSPKLVYVFENFFNWMGKDVQELQFVYNIEINQDNPITQQEKIPNLDSDEEHFLWVDIAELKNIKVMPEVIKTFEAIDLNKITHNTFKK